MFFHGRQTRRSLKLAAFRRTDGAAQSGGLLQGIIAGIAGYGNTIGVPTVGGETQFDSSYNHNPLVNAMAVGLVDAGNLQRGGLAAGGWATR